MNRLTRVAMVCRPPGGIVDIVRVLRKMSKKTTFGTCRAFEYIDIHYKNHFNPPPRSSSLLSSLPFSSSVVRVLSVLRLSLLL